MKDMIDGYKIMMKVLSAEPFSKYISEHTQRPIDINDDSDIEQAMREGADSIILLELVRWEMIPSVVDNRLKVHSMKGLRV